MSNNVINSEVVQEVAQIGQEKCAKNPASVFLLAILAGIFVSFGAQLATMVTSDLARYAGEGLSRFIGGAVFSIGLVLVIIGGTELFTGNNLIFVSVIKGRISLDKMLKNWLIVYAGNFVGASVMVLLMFLTGLWMVSNYGPGINAVAIANAKVDLSFWQAFSRGILCNILVTMAVLLSLTGKDLAGKIFAIFLTIMAFVASGFEHCIANMYYIPVGLLLRSQAGMAAVLGPAADLSNLTLSGFLGNLVPVTLGNIVGGAIVVGGIYGFVSLKEYKHEK